jgi:hypothetical protein
MFEVFKNQQGGFFAFGESASKAYVSIERLSENDKIVNREGTLMACVQRMSALVKRGYTKSSTPMYFDAVDRVFCHTHPDLAWGGTKWLLAASPAGLASAARAVALLARSASSEISSVECDAWEARQSSNSKYLVAFEDHPIWTLVMAEQAMNSGWTIRANTHKGAAPATPPSTSPHKWSEWLQPTFTKRTIEAAIQALQWDAASVTKTKFAAPESLEGENWSLSI